MPVALRRTLDLVLLAAVLWLYASTVVFGQASADDEIDALIRSEYAYCTTHGHESPDAARVGMTCAMLYAELQRMATAEGS